jgi:hypothetical protein
VDVAAALLPPDPQVVIPSSLYGIGFIYLELFN